MFPVQDYYVLLTVPHFRTSASLELRPRSPADHARDTPGPRVPWHRPPTTEPAFTAGRTHPFVRLRWDLYKALFWEAEPLHREPIQHGSRDRLAPT